MELLYKSGLITNGYIMKKICMHCGCCKDSEFKVGWAHCSDKDMNYLCKEHLPCTEFIRLFELSVEVIYELKENTEYASGYSDGINAAMNFKNKLKGE